MRTARDEQFRSYVLTRRAEMLRTATLLTGGDPHLAEDLVQATLTRLYVAWPAFQRATNPAGPGAGGSTRGPNFPTSRCRTRAPPISRSSG